MRTNLTLFLLGILVSCGQVVAPQYSDNSNGEFKPYIQDFVNIVSNHKFNKKLKNTNFMFGDLNPLKDPNQSVTTIGTCYGMYRDKSIIVIDTDYWSKASPTSKAFTMYHEMGHCICNLQHTQPSNGWYRPFEEILFKLGLIEKKSFLDDGCPGSLMHPSDMSEFCMLNNYMYYMDELKRSCNENR